MFITAQSLTDATAGDNKTVEFPGGFGWTFKECLSLRRVLQMLLLVIAKREIFPGGFGWIFKECLSLRRVLQMLLLIIARQRVFLSKHLLQLHHGFIGKLCFFGLAV